MNLSENEAIAYISSYNWKSNVLEVDIIQSILYSSTLNEIF